MPIKKITAVFLAFFATIFTLGSNVFCNNENKNAEFNDKCVVLIEASTKKVLYDYNSNVQVPVGTMNKLMTVLLTAEAIDRGDIALDETIKASSYANSLKGASIWLMPGEEMSVSDLLKGVIIGNANDASAVLAEAVSDTEESFVALMNKRAEELGMNNTVYTNCNGHYDDDKQISTAYDTALLCAELSKYEFLQPYFTTWLDYVRGTETELVNTNTLVKSFKGIIGFKAGYTKNCSNFLSAGASRDNAVYITVTLNCTDKDEMFSSSKALLNSSFSDYQLIKPEIPKEMPVSIQVRNGICDETDIIVSDLQNIVIPKGSYKNVTSSIILPEYVYAPLKKGDKVGEIQYFLGDNLIMKSDITAKEDSEEMTVFKAIVILLKRIFTF